MYVQAILLISFTQFKPITICFSRKEIISYAFYQFYIAIAVLFMALTYSFIFRVRNE